MSAILYPPPRPQSVGETLDSAFRIFGLTVLKCMPYAVAAVIIRELPSLYMMSMGRVTDPTRVLLDGRMWLLLLVSIVIGVVLTAAIPLRQYAMATGHPVDMRGELKTGLRRFGGMLLLAFLVIMLLMVSLLPLVAAFLFSGWLKVLAFIVLLLPVCCVALAISPAWLVLLLTGRGATDSLSYSWQLTWGSWGRLTLIYTVAFILLIVLYLVFIATTTVVAALVARADIVTITAITTIMIVVLSAIATPFYSALLLAVLGDLSVRKEGADLAQRLATPATP